MATRLLILEKMKISILSILTSNQQLFSLLFNCFKKSGARGYFFSVCIC